MFNRILRLFKQNQEKSILLMPKIGSGGITLFQANFESFTMMISIHIST